MKKFLIVYYSRSGNTQRVALSAARACDGTVHQIQDPSPRNGLGGLLRSAKEAVFQADVQLPPLALDLADFSLVLLATPVWAGTLSSPMRAFVTQHAAQIQNFTVLLTHRDKRQQYIEVVRELEEILHRPSQGYLSLRGRDVDGPTKAAEFMRCFV